MNKILRFIAVLLVFAMLLAAVPVTAAGNDPEISVEKKTLTSSDASLKISISSAENVYGGNFNLIYDNNILRFGSCSVPAGVIVEANSQYAPNKVRISFASQQSLGETIEITMFFSVIAKDSCSTELRPEQPRLYDKNGNSVEATVRGAVCDVEVYKHLSSLKLLPNNLDICVGETSNITAILNPSDATIVSSEWVSLDTSVATVDKSGAVTAVGVGNTQIEYRVNGVNGIYRAASCTVNTYPKPEITVNGAYVSKGEEITVAVQLNTTGNKISAGSFNLTYDNNLLKLVSAEKGSMLELAMTTINSSYREDAVRLNFITGQHVLSGYGEVCLLTFQTLADGKAVIDISDTVLYTDKNVKLNAQAEKGTVTVPSGTLSLTGVKVEAWKVFDVTLQYDGEVSAAGGGIVIEYDPTKLAVIDAAFDSAYVASVNLKYAPNAIKVSFASADNASASKLATLRFISLANESAEVNTQITVKKENLSLYDSLGTKIIPKTQNATATIVHNNNVASVGDVNQDNAVDTRDAYLLLQYVSKKISYLVPQQADIDKNGTVNEDDLILLLKYLAEWNVEIPK